MIASTTDEPHEAPVLVRVLNNNAVLARSAAHEEMVLVGRGIGFGRRVGDPIEAESIASRFIEVPPGNVQFLSWANSLGPRVLQTISSAVELAADMLGELHPSVYVLLADHLAFAVHRLEQGQSIHNALMAEIRAAFPQEYAAAEVVVHYLNANLAVRMPADEAAFITLHLNGARTGTTAKQPLQRANLLAELTALARAGLGLPDAGSTDDLTLALAQLIRRVDTGAWRRNAAQHAIARDLPREYAVAERVLERALGARAPAAARGEAAYLAVVLHGWGQDAARPRHARERGGPASHD